MKIPRVAIFLTAVNLLFLLSALVRAWPLGAQAAAPVVIRGQVFELVDDRGRVRSRLKIEESGEIVLRLLDQDGTIRVKLGAGKDGSGLVLLNDATEPGVHLLATATGSSVRVANKGGRERMLVP